MFVRNAWYVAAWDYEVTRTLKRRIILDEPVLLFRKDDGTAVALEDRCCHRQAPLSMGKLIGNVVKCPYHGLEFDTSGKCVKIPSQDMVPASAKVRAFADFRRSRPDAKLLLVGAEAPGFDLVGRLERLGLDPGGVIREPYVEEERLWALIRACDACLFLRAPSMGETWAAGLCA